MSKVICDHCGKASDNLSAAGAGLYCEHCGEPSEKAKQEGLPKIDTSFMAMQRIEHEAWGSVVSELRKRGVADINQGGKDESLHDSIVAWAEELVQLRLHDPDPEHAKTALREKREKYLGA